MGPKSLAGEKGASLPEYAILLAAVGLAIVPTVTLLRTIAGDYLIDTGEVVGESRTGLPTTYSAAAAPAGFWVDYELSYGSNLVIGGSFESPDVSGFDWETSSPWSTTESDLLEIWDSGYDGIASHHGNQHAELNVDGPTTYSQTLSLTSGSAYRWSINHRARDSTSEQMEVLIDGSVVATISSGFSWEEYEGVFTASSSSVTFALRSVGGTSFGNFIDDFRVQEIQT